MTKTTKIKWRLANRPTPIEVQSLHESGLLTKDEAREILFSMEDEEDREKHSLEEEIKFLRKLVEKLASADDIAVCIPLISGQWNSHQWYQPYSAWCSSFPYTQYSATSYQGLSGTNSMYTVNLANSDSATSASNTEPFSSIKTF